MGEFRQFTYSNTGTEIDFMNGIIDIFSNLGATCEDTNGNPTTAELQYADLTGASTATFVFNFGGSAKFTLHRNGTNNNSANYMTLASPTVDTNNIAYAWGPQNVNTQTERALSIGYYKSEKLIVLWIGWYNKTPITQCSISIACLKNNNITYYSSVLNANAITQTFYGDGINGYIAPSIFNYSAGVGKIDYTEKVSFLSSGVKQFDISSVKACSTVSQWGSIALPDGRNFVALSSNLMVEVTEE